MATEKQIKAFIEEIAPKAQKAYKVLGKVKPSICIGMACVESAYGTAGSAKHHSYIGQKVGTGKTATKYWNGAFFTSRTSEEYTVGKHTAIKAAFRAYDSMEQCVFNYYELLNTKLYAKVLASSNYFDQMKQIKSCGYMTSSTEVNSVLSLVKKYNLTKYDALDASKPAKKAEPKELLNPYKEPSCNVKKGSKGDSVKWVQFELIGNGYKVAIDGIFGVNTEAAVKAFQKWVGLTADGIVGAKTRKALKA